MANIPPWSYSSLTKFETCPKQYHIVRVLKKVKEPPTAHTEWGNEVHSALGHRVKDGTPLPEKMQQWEPYAARFAALPGVFAEREYAFNRNLEPVGWWDKDAWCWGIVDVGATAKSCAILADWKTGKPKPDSGQLQLFAAFHMTAEPEVKEVNTLFLWLAHNKATRQDYTADQIPAIWQEYVSRSLRLESAYENDKWPARPSGRCRGWCPVGRENCDFWSPKK